MLERNWRGPHSSHQIHIWRSNWKGTLVPGRYSPGALMGNRESSCRWLHTPNSASGSRTSSRRRRTSQGRSSGRPATSPLCLTKIEHGFWIPDPRTENLFVPHGKYSVSQLGYILQFLENIRYSLWSSSLASNVQSSNEFIWLIIKVPDLFLWVQDHIEGATGLLQPDLSSLQAAEGNH